MEVTSTIVSNALELQDMEMLRRDPIDLFIARKESQCAESNRAATVMERFGGVSVSSCIVVALITFALALAGCSGGGPAKPTVEEAKVFLDGAETKLMALGVEAARAA